MSSIEKPGESILRGERLVPLEQRVFNKIVKAIYEQRLRPGTKLGEEKLAASFSVSRARIRRVLLSLSEQKLVDLIPHRGAFVTKPTEEDARDIFNVRQSLEVLVLDSLAAKSSSSLIEKLRAHVKAETVAHDNCQRHEAIRMAGEFHITLARLSGSRVLQAVLEPVLLQSSLIVSLYGGGLKSSCSVEEHGAIVNALEHGDREQQNAIMLSHLQSLESTLHLDINHDEDPDFASVFR